MLSERFTGIAHEWLPERVWLTRCIARGSMSLDLGDLFLSNSRPNHKSVDVFVFAELGSAA